MSTSNQNHTADDDFRIGALLRQVETVVPVSEERLERGRQRLLASMRAATQQTAPVPARVEEPRAPSARPRSERPLNEVKFLTVAEVASVMRVSKMTVYRLVHSGHLPAIRVGRSFRVPEQAVHEYLRESFTGAELHGHA
jgi:excisionase family DNA binding protein